MKYYNWFTSKVRPKRQNIYLQNTCEERKEREAHTTATKEEKEDLKQCSHMTCRTTSGDTYGRFLEVLSIQF